MRSLASRAAARLPLGPFALADGAPRSSSLPPREALAGALARTLGREALWEPYLLETLLAQPGWAGLVGECERKPELLIGRRRIHLLDYAAITLVAEVGCLERELGDDFAPLDGSPTRSSVPDRVARAQRATRCCSPSGTTRSSGATTSRCSARSPRRGRRARRRRRRRARGRCSASTIARARCAVTSRRSIRASRRSAPRASSASTSRTAARATRSRASTARRR